MNAIQWNPHGSCDHCDSMEQRANDAAFTMRELVDYLYDDGDIDADILHLLVKDVCLYVKINAPAMAPNVTRKGE
jgi:hypothetical protein